MPPCIDHVLQRSFLAIVDKGLRTDVSGAKSAREISYKLVEFDCLGERGPESDYWQL